MSLKTLDQSGLGYLWGKILGKLSTKADLVNGKVPTSQLPASSGGGGTPRYQIDVTPTAADWALAVSAGKYTTTLTSGTFTGAMSAFADDEEVVVAFSVNNTKVMEIPLKFISSFGMRGSLTVSANPQPEDEESIYTGEVTLYSDDSLLLKYINIRPYGDIVEKEGWWYTLPDNPTGGIVVDRQNGYRAELFRVTDSALPLEMLVGATVTISVDDGVNSPTTQNVTISEDDIAESYSTSFGNASLRYGLLKTDDYIIITTDGTGGSLGDFAIDSNDGNGIYFGTVVHDELDANDEPVLISKTVTAAYRAPVVAQFPSDTSGLAQVVVTQEGSAFYRVGPAVSANAFNHKFLLAYGAGNEMTTALVSSDNEDFIITQGTNYTSCTLNDEGPSPLFVNVTEDNTTVQGFAVATAGMYLFKAANGWGARMVMGGCNLSLPADTSSLVSTTDSQETETLMYYRIGDAKTLADCGTLDGVIRMVGSEGGSPIDVSHRMSDIGVSLSAVPINPENMSVDPTSSLVGFLVNHNDKVPWGFTTPTTVTVMNGLTIPAGTFVMWSTTSFGSTLYGQSYVSEFGNPPVIRSVRMPAKWVEADWEHTINRPFYEEVQVTGIDIEAPDYEDDSIPYDELTLTVTGVDGNEQPVTQTVDVRAYRVGNYMEPSEIGGTTFTMYPSQSSWTISTPYQMDGFDGYSIISGDQLPIGCGSAIDNQEVDISVVHENIGATYTFSGTLSAAGIYFLYYDLYSAGAVQSVENNLRAGSLYREQVVNIHTIDKKFLPEGAVLPEVTEDDDEGKFLRVVSGAWTAVEIASASGEGF